MQFSASALELLKKHLWPGNVRELRNYTERCHILMPGESITPENMLPVDQDAAARGSGAPAGGGALQLSGAELESFHGAREAFERHYIAEHLDANDWHVSRTAADIGMERSQLHRKIKAFGLVQPGKESA